jgi:hypothetical protein
VAGGAERSSRGWRVSSCGLGKLPPCSWKTSTGERERSPCGARRGERTAPLCPARLARRSSGTWRMADRRARLGAPRPHPVRAPPARPSELDHEHRLSSLCPFRSSSSAFAQLTNAFSFHFPLSVVTVPLQVLKSGFVGVDVLTHERTAW